MTYKTKADKAFDEKLEALLKPRFIISMSISEFARPLREPIDWTAVEHLFNLYGSYLELLDDGHDHKYSGQIVLVGHGEPSVEEEQTALLNGTIERTGHEMGYL